MVFHLRVFVLTLLSWVIFHRVQAQLNVTLDDQNPAIVYAPAGAWELSDPNVLDYGGSHKLTETPGATATLIFTGVAIYYLSPLWAYSVTTAISLDSGPITLLDLQDHTTTQGQETVLSKVVWSATGLTNTPHTLVISVGKFGIVDGLIYTTINTASSSSRSSSSSSFPSPLSTVSPISSTGTSGIAASATSSSGSTAPRRKFNLAIVLGSVFGLIILLLIFIIVWLSCRRKRNPEANTINGPPHNGNPPGTNGNGNEQAYQRHGGAGEGQALLHGYPSMDGSDGTWQNARHSFVGNMPPPPLGTLHPAQQQQYYAHPQGTSQSGYYDQSASQRAPNRDMSAYTLSSISESSTPQMGVYSPSLTTSASIGAITHPHPHGHPGPDGAWQNAPHSFVGNMAPPPITALHPAQQQPYYDPYQNGYYDQSANNHAPNRDMSAYSHSSITEGSTPQTRVYSPPLTASTSTGANTLASFRAEDLSGYPAAPASQSSGGRVQAAAGDAKDSKKTYNGVQPNNEKGEMSKIQQPPSNQETNEAPPSYSI